MNMPFSVVKKELHLPSQQITYRIYKKRDGQLSTASGETSGETSGEKRRLVLLHGAGVAGKDTWEAIIALTTEWSEILVPDQRGMGETWSLDREEHPFTIYDLVADLNALTNQIGWRHFDLGGYSMGGLVSLLFKQQHPDRVGKQFLLESIVLDRPCWDTTAELWAQFSETSTQLRAKTDVEKGVTNFLNAIAPNRPAIPHIEKIAISRLAERPEGFANALDCVTREMHKIDREELVAAQGDVSSLIGGNSIDLMHQYQMSLAEHLHNWHYFLVPDTDHSLPYQKPHEIAEIMNTEQRRYMAGV